MALDVKELCRLCGKKENFYKDLKDEDNKNILKMIQEFIQIPFAEHDELPTKVCLHCEEKIESFQLFIVECYNVQEKLRQMCLETCEKYPIKLEYDIEIDFNNSAVKSEVKHELSDEDLVNANNSDECMMGVDADYNNDNDDDDNVTLATLKDSKQEKTSERKRMTLTETGMEHLEEISDLNTGDFIKSPSRSRVAAHRRAVRDKVKRYVCDVCARAFCFSYDLRRHRVVHSDDRPYACRTCEKRFKTLAILRGHEETHDDKRRYVCSHCDMAYTRRLALKRHMHSHTGDKPLACEWCDVRYSYPSSLHRHQRRRHPDKMAPDVSDTDTVHADTRPRAAGGRVGYLKDDAVPPKTDVEAS